MKKVCVIGLGYIGLPTASFLATKGHDVHGMDVRADVVKAVNDGKVLIHEPGLVVIVKAAVDSGHLKAHTEPGAADVFILALPTPFMPDKKPDISYVRQGVKEIAPFLVPGNIVVLESTSPVGTTAQICQWLREERPDLKLPGHEGGMGEQVYVAHCPERVLPGRILREIVQNDRIVGGCDEASTQKVVEFYRSFVEGAVFATNCRSAEMVKLVENSFRDVNIAFANELSIVCSGLNMDVWEVIRLANQHPRVNILSPGAGVGGHCISVDPWFLVDADPERTRLIRAAREINDFKSDWVYERVAEKAERFSHPTIACMGLSFKPDVDDLRESPAIHICEKLAAHPDWHILAVEPNICDLPPSLKAMANVEFCHLEDALDRADIFAFLMGHTPFKAIDSRFMLDKVAIDACGLFQNVQKRGAFGDSAGVRLHG